MLKQIATAMLNARASLQGEYSKLHKATLKPNFLISIYIPLLLQAFRTRLTV